jgi:hypothetical protein
MSITFCVPHEGIYKHSWDIEVERSMFNGVDIYLPSDYPLESEDINPINTREDELESLGFPEEAQEWYDRGWRVCFTCIATDYLDSIVDSKREY